MRLALLISILIIQSTSYAQKKRTFNPYVALGVNTSQIEGDGMSGYKKFGGNGGAGVYFKFYKEWSLSTEILYNMKGASGMPLDNNGNSIGVFNRKIILDYAEVPLIISYHDKEYAMFGAGVSLAGLVRSKIYDSGVKSGLVSEDQYSKIDFCGILNVNFIFKKHFGLNLRGSYTIIPITSALNNSQTNNCITIRGMYFF